MDEMDEIEKPFQKWPPHLLSDQMEINRYIQSIGSVLNGRKERKVAGKWLLSQMI